MGGKLFQGAQVAPGQVDDMDVVAHPGAIGGGVIGAEDPQAWQLAHRHLGDEGQEVVGDAVGVLADAAAGVGADGVEVAQQGDVPARIAKLQVGQDLLDEQLGATVGVGGRGGEILADGDAGRVAVDGGGGTEDQVAHPGVGHGAAQAEGSANVVVVVLKGDLGGLAHRLEPGEVDDGVERPLLVAEDRRQGRLVAQVDAGESGGDTGDRRHPAQGLGLAVHQIVDDEDPVARHQ